MALPLRPYGSAPSALALRLAATAALALAPFSVAQGPAVQASPTQAGSTQTHIVEPATPLLPRQFADWTETAPPDPSATLPSLSDPLSNRVTREDGLKQTSTAIYTRSGHPGNLRAEAMQFGDATGAVAAFTFFREPGMAESAPDPGPRNHTNIAIGRGRTLLRQNASLLILQADPGVAPPSAVAVRTLAETLPKIFGPQGLPPLLPTYLPAEELVPGSVEYAVGPDAYTARGGILPAELLAFNKAAEAATASYTVRGSSAPGKLTLLLFPTPEIAGDRGRAIEAWLNSPAAHDANLGTPKLRRLGPLLALATGGFSAAEAQAMVDSIHLHQEVTWNKPVPPEFHVEVRKTASLLSSIIIFSGVAGLAAILLGLFLGFGRAWVRVLMGKPAATEPEFLSLDLRRGPGK